MSKQKPGAIVQSDALHDTDLPRLLRAQEVAEVLQISRSMVYQMMARQELTHIVIGNAKRIHPADLAAYVMSKRRASNGVQFSQKANRRPG
jgi:excisionase family DNA binding protein